MAGTGVAITGTGFAVRSYGKAGRDSSDRRERRQQYFDYRHDSSSFRWSGERGCDQQ